jgi:hypothetical protein
MVGRFEDLRERKPDVCQALDMVERVVNGVVVFEKRLYFRNGKQADWLLTKATSRQERLLDEEIVAASYG